MIRRLYILFSRLLLVLLALLPLRGLSGPSSFVEVGKRVAILLENRHFTKRSVDIELNKQMIQRFVRSLDQSGLYFNKEDLSSFEDLFAEELHTRLFDGGYQELVSAVCSKYSTRVAERVKFNKAFFAQGWDKIQTGGISPSQGPAELATNFAELQSRWATVAKNSLFQQFVDYDATIGPVDVNDVEGFSRLFDKLVLRCLLSDQQAFDESRELEVEDAISLFLSAFAGLYDAHTDYMDSFEYGQFTESLNAESVGIGLEVCRDDQGYTRVEKVDPEVLGDLSSSISINDRLVAIDPANDGEKWVTELGTIKVAKINRLLSGVPNTKVILKLLNADGKGVPRMLTLPRVRIQTAAARAKAFIIETGAAETSPNRVGLITLPLFYPSGFGDARSCSEDLSKMVTFFNEEKVAGVVVDVRGNGGGSFNEANQIAALFLKSGPIVQTKDSLGRVQVKMVESDLPKFSGPMVVLTDRNSASASEVFAAALQDHRRAVLVGQKATFGKGTIQQTVDLGKELPLFSSRTVVGALKMTTQMFYRLSGAPIQVAGVESDLVVPDRLDGGSIGEEFLANHLASDRIRPVSQFAEMTKDKLFLVELKKLSADRVSRSPEFSAMIEETWLMNKAGSEDQFSQDLATQISQSRAERELSKQRADRLARLELEALKSDSQMYRLYEVKLYDAGDAQKLPISLKPEHSPAELPARPATKEVPGIFDPAKREAVCVVLDLIRLSGKEDSVRGSQE